MGDRIPQFAAVMIVTVITLSVNGFTTSVSGDFCRSGMEVGYAQFSTVGDVSCQKLGGNITGAG